MMEKKNNGMFPLTRFGSSVWRAMVGSVIPTLCLLLSAGTMFLTACGGGGPSSSQNSGALAGNWQVTMESPSDQSFVGLPGCDPSSSTSTAVCMGGFLQQSSNAVTGAFVYGIALPNQPAPPTLCSSGSGPVTGSVNGQNVTLSVSAGAVTFALTGTISANGSTMMGTYTSTAGKDCGTAQSGLTWKAILVPPVTGAVQGILHSVNGGPAHLDNQNFPVTGTLTQGPNAGASNATVTGTLSIQGYPCMDTAAVNGQISGNTVVLQVFANNGEDVGRIGAPAGDKNPSPVFVQSAAGGMVVRGNNGYGITTKPCPGGNLPGDLGDICLAFGTATTCTQPILLTPASLTFPPQLLGSGPTAMQITLTNTDPSNSTLNGLTLAWQPLVGNQNFPPGLSDFDGLPNFTEQDTCSSSFGSPFSLESQHSCTITISFSPQQSCPWLPSIALQGEPPTSCPFPSMANLTVNSPKSADSDTAFAVPITGVGLSALTPSTPELDFGSEAVTEKSAPQSVSFTNQSTSPVEILPSLGSPCVNPANNQAITLPRPLAPGKVSDFQVIQSGQRTITPDASTITYYCDSDDTSKLPNFQISSDTCAGRVLNPQDSCSLDVTFVPQPSTPFTPALDYFLELDTLQCTNDTTSDCEIDSGRFPVELKANLPSPLRMSPGAGLDFGLQTEGQTTAPLTIALYNDPRDPNSQTVNFSGNQMRGDYIETDDCGTGLAPGGSCTLTFTFTPKVVGFDPGTFTLVYPVGQTQTIYLRGTGQ